MAISFTCPFCNEAYNNLKEELIGKRVTCRNLNCRKVFVVTPKVPVGAAAPAPSAPIGSSTTTPAAPKPAARQPIKPAPIPKPNAPKAPAEPVDAEALALAAFAEETKKAEVVAKKIPVVCTFCDHHFEVDREMEGRNTPCPECRKLIKVPLLKKEEAVDWRKTDTRDHLKKDIPELEGATQKTSVSTETLEKVGALPKIQYEPLPRWVKVQRFAIALSLLGVIGFGLFYLLQKRGQETEDKDVSAAISAIEKNEESKNLIDLQAGIYRLAAEQRIRTIKTRGDLDAAIRYLNMARDRALKGTDRANERQAELVEIAVTFCSLGGTATELDKDLRLKWDDVQKQVRQTLEKITDNELRLQGVRRVARKLSDHKEAWRAVEVARQIFPGGILPEIAGQVGMELMRLGLKEQAAEFLKKKVGPMVDASGVPTAPSLTALRIALGTLEQPAPLNDLRLIPRPTAELDENARLAYVEALAFMGDYKTAGELANRPGNTETKIRAFLAAGEKALIDNAKDAALPLLDGARVLLLREGKGSNISPWLKVRAVNLIARAGKPEPAAELASTLDKEMQPWAQVELLRGRLQSAPTEPAQEAWLPTVPENTKPRLAHAVAWELFARHQAANGLPITLDTLSPLLKPFAELGTLLGGRDSPGR